jgi:hypothetical protein
MPVSIVSEDPLRNNRRDRAVTRVYRSVRKVKVLKDSHASNGAIVPRMLWALSQDYK